MSKLWRIFLVILVLLLCIGCKSENKPITKSYNYTVVDGRGKKIEFSKPPENIVTLHYSTDEILLDLVDNKRVKAVSRSGKNPELCNNLEKAMKIEKIVEPNVEFMFANKVDCLIIRENYDVNFINQAEQSGIKVVVVKNPRTVDEIKGLLRKMAEIVHEKERGEALVKELEDNIKQVSAQIGKLEPSKQKTAMVISGYGATSLRGSIVDEIFKYAQIRNATEKLEGNLPKGSKVRLSKEQIIACDPDCLLVISVNNKKKKEEMSVVKEFMSDESLKAIKAMRNNEIVYIPMKYTICFSHYIGSNILALSKAVYKK